MTILSPLLAALPILLVLLLMVVFRRSAAVAGAASLLLAVAIAGIAMPPASLGFIPTLVGALVEAIWTASTILWIIFGALLLYFFQQRTGAIEQLRDAVATISDDRRVVAILIAWFFALFAEGAAGFGTAVALSAPFLVGFGFKPAESVAAAMIGHSVGVSFGAVGTPILTQAQLVPHDQLALSAAAATFHVVAGWGIVLFVLRSVRGSTDGSTDRIWPWALLAGVAFVVPMFLLARFVGPELPTMVGSVIGAGVFVAAYRFTHRRESTAPRPSRRELGRAALPYLTVITLVLVTRLVEPLRLVLNDVSWAWSWNETFRGDFRPLFHPGTILTVGVLGSAALLRAPTDAVRGALRDSIRRLIPVALALVAVLGLSRVMVHFGMIELLASSSAALVGGAWPFFAPWVGVLGAFVTGSATASNILFSEFQASTAALLDKDVVPLLGAQSFGAAVGNIVSPHNVIAGGATVGIEGEEGAILRKTIPVCILYATVGGVIALFLT